MTEEQQRQDAIIEACLKDIEARMPHLPLVRKTMREKEFHAKQQQQKSKKEKKAWRKEAADEFQWARMQYAIKFAVEPEATDPVVLDVRTDDPDVAYYLSYYPADRMIGLRVLKALYQTRHEKPEEHSDLVLALRHPDGELYEDEPEEAARRDALLVRHLGRADNLGRFERTFDIDDLGAMLYIQQCRLLGDYSS